MQIDLSRISYSDNSCIEINERLKLDASYYENTDIRELSEVEVNGSICDSGNDTFELKLNIKGVMILPCAISLKDVNYPFNIEIDEILDPNDEENENYLKIINNAIDILPIIWQNIVVDIPMKVVSPNLEDIKLEGDGWKLITEDEMNNRIDPRFDKLKDLLDNREE